LWLLAELTYRCPLHCVFCSNPVDYIRHDNELSTDEWIRVLREARELGAAQLGFSGGEPLTRDDLETLVREARELGYYGNLITSGVGLNETRIANLREAGLDGIQLSFQDSSRELNDFLSHTRTFDLKMRMAQLIKQHGYPIVLNVVLHRQNIDHVTQILEMAEQLDVDYLELANTQYYGWAFLNREHLLPSREQLARAEEATQRFRERHGNRLLCGSRLLRGSAEALHERMGFCFSRDYRRWNGPALSSGSNVARNRVPKCERGEHPVNLVRI
jgi:pyrroloquinoline quinone biosynthesis protein E